MAWTRSGAVLPTSSVPLKLHNGMPVYCSYCLRLPGSLAFIYRCTLNKRTCTRAHGDNSVRVPVYLPCMISCAWAVHVCSAPHAPQSLEANRIVISWKVSTEVHLRHASRKTAGRRPPRQYIRHRRSYSLPQRGARSPIFLPFLPYPLHLLPLWLRPPRERILCRACLADPHRRHPRGPSGTV